MISQDKGKVTFFPNVAPPFLYQNSLSKGRWDFCLKVAREEGSHKEQLCILSGVWPGTPAIPCFSIQSFTVTEIYVNSFNTNKLKNNTELITKHLCFHHRREHTVLELDAAAPRKGAGERTFFSPAASEQKSCQSD